MTLKKKKKYFFFQFWIQFKLRQKYFKTFYQIFEFEDFFCTLTEVRKMSKTMGHFSMYF